VIRSIYFTELNGEFKGAKLTSKGFFLEATAQDFPIREKYYEGTSFLIGENFNKTKNNASTIYKIKNF